MESKQDIKTIAICGIQIIANTRKEFARFAIDRSKELKNFISFSLNGESLAKYHNDEVFRELFLESDFVHADGMSIVSASKVLHTKGLPERIATTDWFHDVAELSEESGVSHYFLGSDQLTIKRTIENVKKRYPKLNIVGYHHGYFSENDEREVLNEIHACKPNFLWLGLGRPRQEKFAIKVRDNCQVGFIKTCGGLFDFLAGNNRRAPELMQNIGLEWLYRLYLQPRRLFKRYVVTNWQSTTIVLSHLVNNKREHLQQSLKSK